MKKLLFLVFIFSIISCSQRSEDALSVKATVIRAIDTTSSDTLKLKKYNIRLSVINKSEKPICYWTMTCSWQENWTTSKQNYGIYDLLGCDSNYPTIICIKPNDSINYNTYVGMSEYKSPFIPVNNLKLAFIYIDTLSCKNIQDFKTFINDRSKQNIIWSNSIDLK